MKRIALLSVLIIPMLVVAGFIVNNKTKTREPMVTFYETPLVCNAAPEIGCGSRSKPVLLELEKNTAVKEAWLNRPGTVIAIVWENKPETEAIAKPIFEKNNVEFTELDMNEDAMYRRTFRKINLWYRGTGVDELSGEEATTIAENSVKYAVENNLINDEEAQKIRIDIEAYFKQELVKIRTNEQLNEDSQNKFREEMFKIAEKYIGKERSEKAMELYQKNCEKQCKKDGSCTQPGIKKDCCDKN
ncbi:MAG: hypothetical protein GC171_05955 [Terrimonas sp.]|nr:hypothetical protein [Terrimonas sp.]